MGKNKEEEGNTERKEENQRKLALQEKEELFLRPQKSAKYKLFPVKGNCLISSHRMQSKVFPVFNILTFKQ